MFTVKTRIVSLLLAFVIAAAIIPFAAFAEDEDAVEVSAEDAAGAADGEQGEQIDENAVGRHAETAEIVANATTQDSNSYNKYYEKYEGEKRPKTEVVIKGKDYAENDGAQLKVSSVDGKDDVLDDLAAGQALLHGDGGQHGGGHGLAGG